MKYFPIFLDLEARKVLAVGGGEAIAQKLRLLLKTGAHVVVVSDHLNDELRRLFEEGRISWISRAFRTSDVHAAALVYAASGDAATNAEVSNAARAAGTPVNIIDEPDLCSFYTPAIVDRDPVVVAIGTEGTAPVLARRIKSQLEAWLPPALGSLARRAQALRPRVADALPEGAPRRRFWSDFFLGRIRELFLAGNEAGYAAAVEEAIAGEVAASAGKRSGTVSLVGAGPGDPDLLTLKAQRRLQEADVIVYDRLVGPGILEYARRDAIRIPVGKTPGVASTSQEEINAILVEQALDGHTVVRLKGGDPYIFGRGGEEQAVLEARDIPVEIVPGITAAAACAASIKLPLTTRGVNRSFSLLTGMTGEGAAEHDWGRLAQPGETFAIYMGVGKSGHIESRLMASGISPDTPVVIVENGTLPNEKCVSTTIAHLRFTIRRSQIRGPAIIYVGLRWPRVTSAATRAGNDTSGVIPFPLDHLNQSATRDTALADPILEEAIP